MTRADDLAAELARAHAEARELRARLAAAEGERDAAVRQAEALHALVEEVRGQRDGYRTEADDAVARAVAGEVALRAVALWLGGPHHPSQPDDVAALARAKAGELDALRAIIEGRTVPPTDAEIVAHDRATARAARGTWW